MSYIDVVGIDVTVGLAQVAHSIASEMEYAEIVEFVQRIDEHIADSHFTDLLKTAVAAL